MYSGNDAATAIAEYVGGSEEAFVNMMNRRAQELMANGTHFMNPHGLHDDNHYTTAYDLYLIFNECIKHEDFVNIIQSEAYTAFIQMWTVTARRRCLHRPISMRRERWMCRRMLRS